MSIPINVWLLLFFFIVIVGILAVKMLIIPSEGYCSDQIVLANSTTGDLCAESIQTLIPPGIIVPFAGERVPDGYLLCDGAKHSSTKYPDLARVLGVTVDTLTVPDLRNRFPIGRGATALTGHNTTQLGAAVGPASGTIDIRPAIQHGHTVGDFKIDWFEGKERNSYTATGTRMSTRDTQWSGSSVISILPPSVVVQYIIKT